VFFFTVPIAAGGGDRKLIYKADNKSRQVALNWIVTSAQSYNKKIDNFNNVNQSINQNKIYIAP